MSVNLASILAVILLVAPIAGHTASPEEIAGRAVASVKVSKKWDRIEVQRAKADDYALIVWYKRQPADYAEVERDTRIVARAMLAELVKAKSLPSKAPVFLVVRGRMPEKGETGKPLVRVFGVTSYDSDSGQLTFERRR
jgi:hypothetical protein